ncbi:hypothetical protein NF867_05930 [Solitalea sp. MAHUQ-68]|uniref:DUF4163 domain-containing protein n=1 Tax=Solitalea agri TaxID=2953739 RepID=A0A9X2F5S3_9SPHI|nr:hypothetical protein [Solitalea agri]MCO4292398.1 hypothetical protein [Solitalea agri]
MNKLYLIFILIAFILVSCNQTAERQNSKPVDTVSVKVDSTSVKRADSYAYTPTYYDYKNTRLSDNYRDTAFTKFSNDTTEDCFTLNIPKGLVTETKTTIRVVTKQGEVIYEHTFATSDLINGYDTEEIKTDVEMEKYILSLAKSLLKEGLYDPSELSEESYLNQATKEDFNDYEVFENIKKTDRIMFHYCLNEESNYYLGYSDKKKKVVKIIDCC